MTRAPSSFPADSAVVVVGGAPAGSFASRLLSRQNLPLAATILVCALLYAIGCASYRGFASAGVLIDFLKDNAFLGIAAVGGTFVILTGGIDLSVGAVIGCTSIILVTLVERHHVHPAVAMALVLVGGVLFGTTMGVLIRSFDLPPFLVTLAGLFFCRGVALIVSSESIEIHNRAYLRLTELSVQVGPRLYLTVAAIALLAVLAVAILVTRYTAFGRNCYALGGSENSAVLMGLPVGVTKIGVYGVAGFCSALAGVISTLDVSSGNALTGNGLELDAIAAVVIGGTLLSGGAGSMLGTFVGVLIFGIIQEGINFQGNLNTWWTKIVIGLLLLIFILLQKLIQRRARA